MFQNQCRAYCQCDFCKNPQKRKPGDTCCLKISKANCDGTGPSKDELYAKCLQETINNRALIASMKNAQRFVPDEMLVSSKKRREAKEEELASLLVPVRRRDRLEEMLVLENQARIREERRLRAERRALGLPEEEEPLREEGSERASGSANSNHSDKAPSSASSQGPQQQRLSGNSTPVSRCSADHDLRRTLQAIEDIVDEEPQERPNQPLSRAQVFQLRKLVHEQAKKSRKQVEECPNQPHLCPHCFAVNVQGKHLCPQMSGSVAFRTTGKVVNPDAGTKFGVKEQQALPNGQYSDNMDSNMLGGRARVANFNPHPHGTGVVFLPVTRADGGAAQPTQMKPRHEFYNGPGSREPIFNNNIADTDAAEGDLQYPGSTYNVYDARDGAYGARGEATGANPSVEARQAAEAQGRNVRFASNDNNCAGGVCGAGVGNGANGVDPMQKYKTTSALWRTTNQDRETDMQRFLDFQKQRMNSTSKQIYDESASRFGPGAAAKQES